MLGPGPSRYVHTRGNDLVVGRQKAEQSAADHRTRRADGVFDRLTRGIAERVRSGGSTAPDAIASCLARDVV